MTDHERLSELNEAYIRASLSSDTNWYDKYLADDFVCINPDATLLDKAQFLRMVAGGSDQATQSRCRTHSRLCRRGPDPRDRILAHTRRGERDQPLHRCVRPPRRRLEGGFSPDFTAPRVAETSVIPLSSGWAA